MKDIIDKISENQIILLIIPSGNYLRTLLNIVKGLIQKNKNLFYITSNKPHIALTKTLNENGISPDNFFFVDLITKQAIRKPKPVNNCLFIDSPTSLLDISIAISEVIEKHKFANTLFDSLSTLLIYLKPDTLTKFVHTLSAKFRMAGCRCIFTILKEDSNKPLIRDLTMFVDIVIKSDEHG